MAISSIPQRLFLAALPAGGQGASRRNAWSAMAADAARSRARREAEMALAVASAPQGQQPTGT